MTRNAPHDGVRILTYSHDGFGIGHLRRNLRLATRLVATVPDASILAATGSRIAHCFEFPPNVDYLKLPSVIKLANDEYVADGLSLGATEVSQLRSGLLESAVRHYEPDIVVVDRYPLGVNGELVPALDALRARRPDAIVILGLRDILDEPSVVREEWRTKGHDRAIAERYNRVLVYGDPRVYNASAEYNLPDSVARMISFTGYLAEAEVGETVADLRARLRVGDRRLALCTVGGGKDAAHIAWAFVGALEMMRHQGWTGLLVTGPFLDDVQLTRLTAHAAPLGIEVRRFVSDLPAHLAAADVVVSMAGYNTMCEVLATAAPTVVVPRIRPRVEQLIRATRFAERGAVTMLHPDRLNPSTLQAAMARWAEVPRAQIRTAIGAHFDLNGLAAAAGAVAAACQSRPAMAS